MRIIQSFFVIIATLLFLINLRCSFNEFSNWRKAIHAQNSYSQEIAGLKAKLDQLKIENTKLQTDPLTRERLVRKYGYSYPDEQIYRILRSNTQLFN